MVSLGGEWWRRHGWTIAVLLGAFSISFLIRTLYAVSIFQQWGPSYLFAGGSDSFYHWRVSDYIILNHTNLGVDAMLKYPFGAINPREPLFDWMNAILGILLAPFFGGSAELAGRFSLELAGPLWAAFGVFPIYLIGREVSSRRVGLIAALIYPLLVANIDSSTFAYANYLSFYTFFILVMIYAYLRTIKAAGTRRWVDNYAKPRTYLPALRAFLRTERVAVKWAVFAGVAFGVVILTWQGYTFLVAAIVVFLAFAMIVERIRRVDSLGLYLSTWIVGLVGFPMAFPYYYVQNDYRIWFLEPVFIYFGALLILAPFVALRDSPWVISIPVLIGTAGGVIGGLAVLAPTTFADLLSGQGYFVKTLIYTTVAEAQAPSIDALILGYGVVTFFLAFAGLAFVAYHLARDRFQRRHMFFLVFAVLSIYLPISAAKFFFIGSAAFSLLPAEAISRVLDIGGYPTLRRNVASLSDRRGQFSAFRRSFKARHVLVLLLVVLIVTPNVWYSIDAGIPYNVKGQYNLQIYNTIPSPLRTAPGNASNYYLGAAGSQIDTPDQYDEAGYDWLAQQDQNLPPADRPAFISWWDYGFQSVSEGAHPTVADNFQNGIDPAGNFLLSQNESQAIAILATTLLLAEQSRSGAPYLPGSLNAVLARDGVDLSSLHTLMVNQSRDIPIVLAHPERYLPVDRAHLDAQNAMFDTVSYFLSSTLPLSGVAQLYNDIQAYTGWSIRYAMTDSRLFPFSGSNTGIFYAPADLTDRIIGPGGQPTTYFTVSVLGSDGHTYAAGQVPPGVTPVNYNINWLPPFYHSMIYRTFIGYNGTEIGVGGGIPGLSGNAGGDPIEPGWMMQHFQVVYRTAYYCPQKNPAAGSNCFRAMNLPDALRLAKAQNGTADTSPNHYFSGGEAMLEYYPGEVMSGTIDLPNGAPVPHVRVTVYDSWGIPHMTNVTAADGSYSLVLPPGSDHLNISTGAIDLLSAAGSTHLATINVTVPNSAGYSLDAAPVVEPIILKPATISGFVYWNAKNSSSYDPAVDPLVSGATVVLSGPGLGTYRAKTDASGSYAMNGVAPSVYNISIVYRDANLSGAQLPSNSQTVTVLPGKTVNETIGLSDGRLLGSVTLGRTTPAVSATVTVEDSLGVVARTLTNSIGNFTVPNLPPDNYTVTAGYPPRSIASNPVAVHLAKSGANATVTLELARVVPASITIDGPYGPMANVPVRFTEIASASPNPTKANATTNISQSSQQKANSTVVLTGPDGVAATVLPEGNYSVYALAWNGSTYYSGFWSGPVRSGQPILPTLAIRPAFRLAGNVTSSTSASLTAPAQVSAYDASGHVVWAFTNASRDWSLWLPGGTYSLLGTEVSPVAAAIAVVRLPATTSIALNLSGGLVWHALVSTSGTVQPIVGATVTLTALPMGATITTVSDPSGNVTAVVPQNLGPAATYCVNASAPGYRPLDRCGVTAPALPSVASFELAPAPVAAAITFVGVPSGAPVHLDLTAVSATARSVSATGVASVYLSLAPGTYLVAASASPFPGSSYQLEHPFNWTVPIGAGSLGISLHLVEQILAHGSFVLPPGVVASSIAVRLSSPSFNTSTSGSAFLQGFSIAPGAYRLIASVAQTSSGYVAVQNVSVNASGGIGPVVDLTHRASFVIGGVHLNTGALFNASFNASFVSPTGAVISVAIAHGAYQVLLPINTTFHVFAQVVANVTVQNRTVLELLTLPAGDVCDVLPIGATCDLSLSGSPVVVTVSGSLTVAGSPAGVPGSLRLVGPSPSSVVVTVPTASDGSFVAHLVPGTYGVYANATSGGYAVVATLGVGATNESGLDLLLVPSWSVVLTLTPPPRGTTSNATIAFASLSGPPINFTGEPFNTPIAFTLPPGSYRANATAPANPYGVPTIANASARFVLTHGNLAVGLRLVDQLARTARLSVVPPSQVTLPPGGGRATFGFAVHNSGNAPENLTFQGTPSAWNFTFVPRNVSLGLGPANSTLSVTVTIVVPAGTSVNHPTLGLIAYLRGTTLVAGNALPPPTINVLPSPGIRIGASPSVQPSVRPTHVTIAFYAANTGNLDTKVALSIVDGSRLASLGWSAEVTSDGHTPITSTSVNVGGNNSLQVVLNATGGHALTPGNVTIGASIPNASGSAGAATLVLTVPTLSVSLNGSAVTVTGPGIGSPPSYPDWLVPALAFVPALALIAGLLTYRWYRTRRWSR